MLRVVIIGVVLSWTVPSTLTYRTVIQRGHTQIKPKPCTVNGVEGTCMFVYECIKTDGKHIGMCVDNFMFGSCCSHNLTQNTVIPQDKPNILYSPSGVHSSLRPSSPSVHPRPSSPTLISKVRPSKPVHFVTKATKRPPVNTGQWTKQQGSSTSKPITEATTIKPYTATRPWAHKTHSFVTTSGTPASITQSLHVIPVNSSLPTTSPSTSSSFASVYDLIATSKPTHSYTMPWPSTTETTRPSSSSAGSTLLLEAAESNTIVAWSTAKPLWTSVPAANDIWTSSAKPSKPEAWGSGKPNSYVNRPSWQSSTETLFVTRPRPSSNLSARPKPTRRPILPAQVSNLESATRGNLTVPSNGTLEGPMSSMDPPRSTTQSSSSTISTTSGSSSSSGSTDATTTDSTSPSGQSTSASQDHECGVSSLSPRPEMRIVGGKNAPFGGWPWQVSVRRTSFFGFSSTHRCGGAVINENWIATAGHCVDDLLTSQIRIRVGEYDFSSVLEPYPFVERGVSKKIVHPKYNFFTYEYDLALVRLESPLEFQPHIAPICLPGSDDLLIGENATVTGWGRLSEGGTLPSVLQQVSVPIVSNDKCKSMFLRAGRHEFIPDIFLCAGYENGGQDSCQGDSGGPLQVKGKNGRYFLAGIISWGIGCAEANLPGVCTRISKFVPWILEHVT